MRGAHGTKSTRISNASMSGADVSPDPRLQYKPVQGLLQACATSNEETYNVLKFTLR
jgi:hypothetical protein